MEGREAAAVSSGGGVTVVSSDAPSPYQVASRLPENKPSLNGQLGMSPASLVIKKKRGRPRKYRPGDPVISPKPISSAAPASAPAPATLPPVIDFTTAEKRGKVRPLGMESKTQSKVVHHEHHLGSSNFGILVACSGANFTPHVIAVNTGEDITKKIISFSQQGPRAICILSANGVISSVTLRQSDTSGGTLTYEGRFEILSLTGSFMPSETSGARSRTGGMSVSLASPDGRVIGGSVAGLLVAATPVQIVVGSFTTINQYQQQGEKMPKKPDYIAFTTARAAVPISTVLNMEEAFKQGPPRMSATTTHLPNLTTASSFLGNNSPALASDQESNPPTDVNISASGS